MEGSSGKGGLQGSRAGSPDLFRRSVDNLPAPYARLLGGESYKFSNEEFARVFGHSEQEARIIEEAVHPNTDELNDAQRYISKEIRGEREKIWYRDSGTGSSSLFRRSVDNLLAPYVRLIEGEGYRFSTQKFAELFGHSSEEARIIREAVHPKAKNGSTVKISHLTDSRYLEDKGLLRSGSERPAMPVPGADSSLSLSSQEAGETEEGAETRSNENSVRQKERTDKAESEHQTPATGENEPQHLANFQDLPTLNTKHGCRVSADGEKSAFPIRYLTSDIRSKFRPMRSMRAERSAPRRGRGAMLPAR